MDPEQWYRDKNGIPPTYQGFLAAMAQSQEERQRMLRPYFDPTERDLKPTAAHRAIAKLVKSGHVSVILTANFDKLMEDSLHEVGIHPTVIETPATLSKGLSPIHTLGCCVIHLHGDYLSPAAMLNTVDELEVYAPELESLIKRILGDYGLIIAGWSSVYDQALKELIQSNYPGRYTPTWIEPFAQSKTASDQLAYLNGTLFQADADESLEFLADAITSIAENRGRHPLTIPTAAAMPRGRADRRPSPRGSPLRQVSRPSLCPGLFAPHRPPVASFLRSAGFTRMASRCWNDCGTARHVKTAI